MIVFDCAVCRKKLSAQEPQAGTWVLCPNCRTKLQVPSPVAAMSGVAGTAMESSAIELVDPSPPPAPQKPPTIAGPRPGASAGKRYGFNCGYCSSRLEATESMAAQDGQCPTCGNNITIPIQDRYGRLIDPKTRQIIKQDPHPVHAYAAAGDRAPAILRQGDGKQIIRCARCGAASQITANNCKACGMPFTMEGTTLEASGTSNGFAVAGLVLGIIGVPAGCTIIPPLLAIIFGWIGYTQISKGGGEGGGRGMAITGITLGVIGMMIGVYVDFLNH
jgi:DNA-directed RNA polymerase subunit RPC12/RpoP